uniref:MULE transposase domain-containing protein n=1 Tax=Heliothis virescens TaxID=7102 RepID=A0A2A4K3L7_HELVI
MFKKIKEAIPDFNPKKFILDFEAAAINAIEHVFPEAVIHGCFVHFQRSVYRKAKSLGLLDHEETSAYVRMCICLAYLPSNKIEDGWLAIIENSLPAEPVTKFNNYFVEQWLEPDGMIAKWCCYKEQHRSTNLVEAWNNRLKCHLGSNPTLLLFLQVMLIDIASYDTAQEKLRLKAIPITKKKRKSIINEKTIAKLTKDYAEGHTALTKFLEDLSEIVLITPKKTE